MRNHILDNRLAIEALQRGNEEQAQKILKTNKEKFPSCMTLHNLGVLYYQYGMIRKDNKIYNAKKIGFRLLNKASNYEADWRNCASIASALYEDKAYVQALDFVKRSRALADTALLQYNMAVLLYRLGMYGEALSVTNLLSSDQDASIIVQNGGSHPCIFSAYCHIMICDLAEGIKCIRKYHSNSPGEDRLDVFYIKYLCGLYEEALSESTALLKEWYPYSHILAAIAECANFFPEYLERVKNTLSREQQDIWDKLCEDSTLRKLETSQIEYIPPFIPLFPFIF